MRRSVLIAVYCCILAGNAFCVAQNSAWAAGDSQVRIATRLGSLGAPLSVASEAAAAIQKLSISLETDKKNDNPNLPWSMLVRKAEELNCGHALIYLNESNLELALRSRERHPSQDELEISGLIGELNVIFQKICGPQLLPTQIPRFQHTRELDQSTYIQPELPAVRPDCLESCILRRNNHFEAINSYALLRFDLKQRLKPQEEKIKNIQTKISDASRFVVKFEKEFAVLNRKLKESSASTRSLVEVEVTRARENLRAARTTLARLQMASKQFTRDYQDASQILSKAFEGVSGTYRIYVECIKQCSRPGQALEVAKITPPADKAKSDVQFRTGEEDELNPHPTGSDITAPSSSDYKEPELDREPGPEFPSGTVSRAPEPFAFKALQEYLSGIAVKQIDQPESSFGRFENGKPIFVTDENLDLFCGQAGFHNPRPASTSSYIYWSGFAVFCSTESSVSLGGIAPPTAHQLFKTPTGEIFDLNTATASTSRQFDLDGSRLSVGGVIGAAEHFSESILVGASLIGQFDRRKTSQNATVQYNTIGFQILDDREIDVNRLSVGGKLSAYWSPLLSGNNTFLEAFFLSIQARLNLDDVSAKDRFRTIKFGNIEENIQATLSDIGFTTSWQADLGARVKLGQSVFALFSVFAGLEEEWQIVRRHGAQSRLETDEAFYSGAKLNLIVTNDFFSNFSD